MVKSRRKVWLQSLCNGKVPLGPVTVKHGRLFNSRVRYPFHSRSRIMSPRGLFHVDAKDNRDDNGVAAFGENILQVSGNAMTFLHRVVRNAGTAGELFVFFSRNKRWWLLPMLIVLSLFSALIVLAESSVIAPFIYSLF